jgi:hypothetical protein
LRREDHDGEARGEQQRAREALAGRELEQPSAAKCEARQHKRVRDPGDE